jgi:hypothetical protein
VVPGPRLRLALFGAKLWRLLPDDVGAPWTAAVAAALHSGWTHSESQGKCLVYVIGRVGLSSNFSCTSKFHFCYYQRSFSLDPHRYIKDTKTLVKLSDHSVKNYTFKTWQISANHQLDCATLAGSGRGADARGLPQRQRRPLRLQVEVQERQEERRQFVESAKNIKNRRKFEKIDENLKKKIKNSKKSTKIRKSQRKFEKYDKYSKKSMTILKN